MLWIHFLWGSLAIGWKWPRLFLMVKAIQRNDDASTMKSHKYPEITEKSQEKTSILLRSTEKNQLFNFINHHQPVHIGLLKYPWPIAAQKRPWFTAKRWWDGTPGRSVGLTTKNGALISNKCWLNNESGWIRQEIDVNLTDWIMIQWLLNKPKCAFDLWILDNLMIYQANIRILVSN